MSIVVTVGERTASLCRPALAVFSDALKVKAPVAQRDGASEAAAPTRLWLKE
jgi:hypothetical protein